MVDAGKSDASIEQFAERYGSQEILSPHGGSGAVAIGLPIGAFVLAAIALGIRFTRRRGSRGDDDGVPEEDRALRLKLRSAYRTVVPFYDYTYSPPKSVSVLWASLLSASANQLAYSRVAMSRHGQGARRAAQRTRSAGLLKLTV